MARSNMTDEYIGSDIAEARFPSRPVATVPESRQWAGHVPG